MSGFRFVHAADLHLGSPFRGLAAAMPAAVRERVLQAAYASLTALAELTIRERADFVVIAGDIYDAADRSLQAQIRFQQAMAQLGAHGIPVFVAHGNHDPADGRTAQLEWPANVRFFASQQVESFVVRRGGDGGPPLARVYGISYETAETTANLARLFRKEAGAPYHIGVLHANVDGEAAHANYAPCSLRDLTGSGMQYWALGHVHSRRVLHEAPHVVYPGNLQGRSVRETGAKGCYVVDVGATGETRLTFHALDAVRWFRCDVGIAGMQSEQALKDRLEREIDDVRERAGGRPAIVRIALGGRGPLHERMRRAAAVQELAAELRAAEEDRVQRCGADDFVWLESLQAATGADVDREALLTEDSFLGDMMRLSAELADDDAALARLCEEALEPLMMNGKAAALLGGVGAEERRRWLAAAEELALDALASAGAEARAAKRYGDTTAPPAGEAVPRQARTPEVPER